MWVNLLSIVSALTITNARHAEQCRCLRKADGSCLPYDPRYMAMNLEEAMVSFPDLLLTNPPDPVDVQNPTPYSSNCLTEECVSCQEDIRQRLTQIGMANFVVHKRSNVPCNRYHFSRYRSWNEDEDSVESDSSDDYSIERHWRKHGHRKPRQISTSVIGTRFNISCVGKGYATCMEGLRNLEVIRNDSGTLTTVLLTSGTYCECRAKQQSPIYNLIVGSSANGNIPTL
ncbi:Uncharacterized protein T16H12.9 [Toxocara canis]|uniref:Uncharacterized protein T16H12.9 n=1 Tax=Toxocara canis TaxID=6265 RepID=A0A0B2VHC7_TOXCA|nr:Uncharacterized protein T16H12.9 [Toxocara canis]